MEQKRIPKPGEFYKHFKGNLYQIITVATHTETGEAMVVYQALYGDFKTYVRPLEMFVSKVDRMKYPKTSSEYRFELQMMELASKNIIDTSEKVTNIINENEESSLDPNLFVFLDAKTYEDKFNILVSLRNKINERLIEDIAISMDIILEDGTLEEKYEILKDNLLTLIRYECGRRR